MHRDARKKLRAPKKERIEGQCSAIEKSIKLGDSKKAYNTLKSLTKTSQPRVSVIDDKGRKLLTE